MQRELAELHVHLRGACPQHIFEQQANIYSPQEVIARISSNHLSFFKKQFHLLPYLSLGEQKVDLRTTLLGFKDFPGFIASYLFSKYFFQTKEDFSSLAHGVVTAIAEQSIKYCEITINIDEYIQTGIAWDEIFDVLADTTEQAPIQVLWIVDIAQARGIKRANEIVDRLITEKPKSVVGLTIGGGDEFFPREPCVPIYKKAKAAGLHLTSHAGESDGPESVWFAIDSLEVDRIGHGIKAINDKKLCQELASRHIPLEICPTSNLKTGVVSAAESHPVKELFDMGVEISINTDDPFFFNTTIRQEFDLISKLGFSDSEIDILKQNAFKHAWSET